MTVKTTVLQTRPTSLGPIQMLLSSSYDTSSTDNEDVITFE